jgi:uncharacterized protein YndB with AHSA1/START domain
LCASNSFANICLLFRNSDRGAEEVTSKGSDRILGNLRSEDGAGVVRVQDRLDAEPAEVWFALTDPSRLAEWYGEVEGDLRPGGEFRVRVFATGAEGIRRVEVCEPPRRLRIAADAPLALTIEVELSSDGDETVVIVEARGMPVDLLAAYGAGLQIHVEDLSDHVAGRERRDAETRWDELESAYKDMATSIG